MKREIVRALIIQVVVAMGWTVRESNSGGVKILCTRPDRLWGLPSLLYNEYRVLFFRE
jgi:hypothetical protein